MIGRKFVSSLDEKRYLHVHYARCLEQCLASRRYSLDSKNRIESCSALVGSEHLHREGGEVGKPRGGWGHRFYSAKDSEDNSGAVMCSPSGDSRTLGTTKD